MNILVRRILYVLQYLPLVICLLYPCLYSFSSVLLLLHVNIFSLKIFRSDTLSAFVSCIVVIQAFVPSVSMGHIRVLYSFNLVLRHRNYDLKSLIFSLYTWFAVMVLEWISVHFSFSLFTVAPKYVTLSTHLSSKSPLVRCWRCCLPCVER